jgi:hypothetical protein
MVPIYSKQTRDYAAESRMIQVAYSDNKVFTEAIMPTMWLLKHSSPRKVWN